MLIRIALSIMAPAGRRSRLTIFIFHRVVLQVDPLMPDVPDPAAFDRCLSWIGRWFQVLPLSEAVDRLRQGDLPARAAAITFDDGYADNLLHAAPILRRHGMSATFFIATGFINGGRMWNDSIIEAIRHTRRSMLDCEHLGLGLLPLGDTADKRAAVSALISGIKHQPTKLRQAEVTRVVVECGCTLPDDLMLTTQQLRELHAQGMGIGAHTVTHPILTRLDSAEARQEIASSKSDLESMLDERIDLFAYPNGKSGEDYGAEHASIVESLGFKAAVSTNWGVSDRDSDRFQLPRFTPWDAQAWKFGLRALMNLRKVDRRGH